MASPASLRDELKTRLDTISGLQVFDHVPDSMVFPCGFVYWTDVDYHATMGGSGVAAVQWSFEIRVAVGSAPVDESYDRLDAYVADSGSSSVIAAIQGDRTLGGSACDAEVLVARYEDLSEALAVRAFGAVFEVIVITQ